VHSSFGVSNAPLGVSNVFGTSASDFIFLERTGGEARSLIFLLSISGIRDLGRFCSLGGIDHLEQSPVVTQLFG
jgi:hypothetical protein